MFQLERESKAQSIIHAHDYIAEYSTYGMTSGKKVCRDLKMAAILKMLKYQS